MNSLWVRNLLLALIFTSYKNKSDSEGPGSHRPFCWLTRRQRDAAYTGRRGLLWTDKGVTATLGPLALLHKAGVLACVSERAPTSPGTL